MVSKDQAIGGVIFIICAAVGILYFMTLVWPGPWWLSTLGLSIVDFDVRFWTLAVPVLIAFIAIMGIGAWIGWTMATTPPPKPIEEITSEISEEKEKEEAPPPAEEPKEEKTEEKKPEKKRKGE